MSGQLGRTFFAAAFLVMLSALSVPLSRKAIRLPGSGLAESFPLKRWFVELNGGMHRLAGRRLCNTVYRTSDGVLLVEYRGRDGIAQVASNTVAFSEWLASRAQSVHLLQLLETAAYLV